MKKDKNQKHAIILCIVEKEWVPMFPWRLGEQRITILCNPKGLSCPNSNANVSATRTTKAVKLTKGRDYCKSIHRFSFNLLWDNFCKDFFNHLFDLIILLWSLDGPSQSVFLFSFSKTIFVNLFAKFYFILSYVYFLEYQSFMLKLTI